MPLYKEYQWTHFHLLIWKIDAAEELPLNIEDLSETDQKRFRAIKNHGRQREFLSVRAALSHICEEPPQIEYSPKGAPKIPGYSGLSLSHTANFAVALISKEFKVGVDLEAYRPQMTKLAPRFLSKQEMHGLEDGSDLKRIAAFWCAKEAIIKLKDAPELDLREAIRISPFLPGRSAYSKAVLRHQNQIENLPLYYLMENDFCLCFCFS